MTLLARDACGDAAGACVGDARTDEARLRPHAVGVWSLLALVVAAWTLAAHGLNDPGLDDPGLDAPGAVRPRVAPPVCRIDLSTAPVEELALLPEVGPSLAARIAADRAVRGPFASVDDLARVRGIGEHKLAELRDAARASAP
jgi:hypothetical protein